MISEKIGDLISLVGSKILIKEESFDETTNSGLKFLKKDENKTIGVVLFNNKHSKDYEIGHKVVYPNFAGVNVEIDGEKYKTLETREIFFTYNEDEICAKNNFIVVKPIIKSDGRTLKLAKEKDESNTNGIVISVSNNVDIPIGCEAVFSKFSGFTITNKNGNHVVLAEEEIFFIIKKQKQDEQ